MADRDSGTGVVAVDAEISLPAHFERVAAVHSARTALGSGAWQPTYGELNITANRLAHSLIRRGGALGDCVALLMQHDSPLIAATLAVLKAGRIVVVLNPTYPAASLRRLLEDAQASTIVIDTANRTLAADVALPGCGIVPFDTSAVEGPAHNPAIDVSAGTTAFLIYTSGSTGRPKAIMRTHRQILHNAVRQNTVMRFTSRDRLTLFASLSGAQGVSNTWCALAFGAALCPFPVIERGFSGLAEWMERNRITGYWSSASLFRQFMRTLDDGTNFSQVRVVRLASEPATSDDFNAFQKHFSKGCAFAHTLSSSETGSMVQMRLSWGDAVPEGRLPIGTPPEGVEILLLDDEGRPVGPGESGEIAIRSRYLFAGYWRNNELTAERFSDGEGGGTPLYRTGDMGRFNPDGLLAHLGRKDARAKLRGYRIELSEVEAVLLQLAGVERAIVDTVERAGNEPRLVAYVVLRPGQSSSGSALRRALRAVLPSHMVPSAVIFLDQYPLTPHGKVDREKLRQIYATRHEPRLEDAPSTQTEKVLADIWGEAFELSDVTRHDDFFDLGGDSLVAAVIAAKLHTALGIDISLGAFVEHPTLAELARALEEAHQGASAGHGKLVRASRDRPLPLSLFQERTWRFSQSPQMSASYTTVRSYRLRGPLDYEILRECISYIARRHEILRTTFDVVDGQAVQIIHPPAPVNLPLIDLSGAPDAEERSALILEQEGGWVFDLNKGPLLRFTLIRMHEVEHRLIRINHHINSDGWSWNIYFQELALLYEAKLRGENPPLPDFEPLQYADYASWQRQELNPEGPTYKATVAWWKSALQDPPRPIELPFKRLRPLAGLDPSEGVLPRNEHARSLQLLRQLGRDCRATYFMVRLAAFLAVLGADTGESDLIVGIYMTNRNRLPQQNMFGLFANLVTFRIQCDLNLAFRDWLSNVRRRLLETEARGELPYEELRAEFQRAGMVLPEIRVIFGTQTYRPAVKFAGLDLTLLERHLPRMPWGLTVTFREAEEARNCEASFDAAIHNPQGVAAFLERLCRFLDAASQNPDAPVRELLRATQQSI